jgi:4-amino-4-deoxy-L-arabinose transferase-like glycosyltransferase
MKIRHAYFIVVILLAIAAIRSGVNIQAWSPTHDETFYLSIGNYYVKTWDFSKHFERPPLLAVLSGLAVSPINPKVPEGWNQTNQVLMDKKFLYEMGNDLDSIILITRSLQLIFYALLGIVIFLFAKDLYGINAGIFAVFLYTLEPNFLGHSILATSDVPIAFFMTLSIYTFYRFVKDQNTKNLTVTGIVTGLAYLTKFSAVYLLPIMLVFGLITIKLNDIKWKKFTTSFITIILITLLVINIGYVFQGSFQPVLEKGKTYQSLESYFEDKPGWYAGIVEFALFDVPMPVPHYYALGFANIVLNDLSGHSSFLLGEYSRYGWWYYFPVAFMLKAPIPLMLLLFVTAFIIIKYGFQKRTRLAEYFLISFSVLYLLVSMQSSLNIGVRHIFPIFPAIIILSSSLINHVDLSLGEKSRKINVKLIALILVSVWYVITSVAIHPHYIAYFNEFVGPDNGHLYLADSNIDWGQDLKNLKLYLESNGIEEVKLKYFGTAPPEYYGIKYENLTCEPTQGIVAISTNYLQNVFDWQYNHTCYNWLKQHRTIAKIGYSIHVYNITYS